MLHNEATIEDTYKVVEGIFQDQRGGNSYTDLDELLQLIYGDQKQYRSSTQSKKNKLVRVDPSIGLAVANSWTLPLADEFSRHDFRYLLWARPSGSGINPKCGTHGIMRFPSTTTFLLSITRQIMESLVQTPSL